VRLTTPSSFYVVSIYWKPASTTSPLDLPTDGDATFIKVTEVPFYYLIHVKTAVLQGQHLAITLTFWTYVPRAQCSTLCVLEGFFLSSLDPRAPYTTLTKPRSRLGPYTYTLIGSLRDMGTHGSPPTRVPEVPVKWTRLARSPADL
jgi:hypothetical protein